MHTQVRPWAMHGWMHWASSSCLRLSHHITTELTPDSEDIEKTIAKIACPFRRWRPTWLYWAFIFLACVECDPRHAVLGAFSLSVCSPCRDSLDMHAQPTTYKGRDQWQITNQDLSTRGYPGCLIVDWLRSYTMLIAQTNCSRGISNTTRPRERWRISNAYLYI